METDEAIEEQLNDMATWFSRLSLPGYMWEPVRLYFAHGVIPGDFLCALFENQLIRSFEHADSINIAAMPTWVMYLKNHVPLAAIGSSDAFQQWCADGGMYGRVEKATRK